MLFRSGIPMFHAITNFNTSDKLLDDSRKHENDNYTAEAMVKDIETYAINGQFFNTPVYSWQYSTTRIKLAMEKLEQKYPGVYQFVTIDELEELYRQSVK